MPDLFFCFMLQAVHWRDQHLPGFDGLAAPRPTSCLQEIFMTDLAETGSRIGQERANRLAIDGGVPVRREPLPWELPGVHWIGEEERELVDRVVRARSPFRFYGPDPQHMVETLEREWCEAF